MNMGSPDPDPRTSQHLPPLWRSARLWRPLGYFASFAWIAAILIATEGNTRAPLFQYVFIVPLAGWVVGLAAAAIIKRRLGD